MAFLLTLGSLVVAGLLAMGLAGAGLPATMAFAIAALLVGLVTAQLGHADLDNDYHSVMVAGYALACGVAPIAAAIYVVPDSDWEVNPWLVIVVGAVVGLLLSLFLRILINRVTGACYGAWRSSRRRRLAASQGWRLQRTDQHVLAYLREAQFHAQLADPATGHPMGVSVAAGQPVTAGTRAVAVLAGEANQIPFVAFDYFEPYWLQQPVVTTVALVRLPQPLPPFHARFPDFPDVDLFDLIGKDARRLARAPVQAGDRLREEYRQAVLTPGVSALTNLQLPGWWIAGPWLVVAVSPGPARRLAVAIDTLTKLATMLDWPALARHAISGSGTGSRST